MKNERTKKGWSRAGLGFFHLLLHGEEALGVHGLLRQSVAVKDVAKLVVIEGVLNALAKTGANFRLVAVADGLQE